MKKNIKIMNPPPMISDDEIRSFMDFNGLIRKHNSVTTTRYRRLKWAIGLSGIAIITGFTITMATLFNSPENKSSEIQKSEPERGMDPATRDTSIVNSKPAISPLIAPDQIQRAKNDRLKTTASDTATRRSLENRNEKPKSPVDHSENEHMYLQAEPEGGYDALYDYFNKNLKYPPEAIKDSLEGMITVSFIVTKEGTTEHFKFKKSIGKPFEREALKLLNGMPRWKPAMLNGKHVPSRIVLPLTFSIDTIK